MVNGGGSPWNLAKLEENYGPFWAKMINAYEGDYGVAAPQTIMGFDCPAAFGASVNDCRGGGDVIGAECFAFLYRHPIPGKI